MSNQYGDKVSYLKTNREQEIIVGTPFGNYGVEANSTATVIAGAGTFVKAAGVTTPGSLNQQVTHTDNRLTMNYDSVAPKTFSVRANISIHSGTTARNVSMEVRKNDAKIGPFRVQGITTATSGEISLSSEAIISLDENDYVEIWVSNLDNTDNVTVTEMNLNLSILR